MPKIREIFKTDEEEEEDEEEDEEASEYDILPQTERDDSLVQKVLRLDLSTQPLYTQVAVGGASGWVFGFVCSKVGKAVAAALGGSMLLIHLGSRAGYLTIDWKKVDQDMTIAKENVSKKLKEEQKNPKTKALMEQSSKFITKNIMAVGGFLGGFFLGMAS